MININFTTQCTVATTNGNKKESISLKDPQSLSVSGSKIVDLNIPLTGSGFTSLMTGSISDFRYLYLYNTHTASFSAVIVQSSSVASVVAVLGPKDSIFLCPSQSVSYFAKASGSGANLVTVRVAGIERVN